MARLKKQKTNYEEQFIRLYKEKNIGGNADLLRRMFEKYYKDKLEEKTQSQVWVDSQLPDFRKKIKGNRSFLESDIKAIERALNMSWVDIVESLPETPKKTKNFENRGLRYASFIDEEWYYQELADTYDVDKYNCVLFSYDEYGKTVIDYVIENKAENGLKFLIDKEYLGCDSFLQFYGSIYRTKEHSEKLWDWIISIDDSELFFKALGEHNLLNFYIHREDEGEGFLEKIIESHKIFEALCREKECSDSKVKYMSRLLFELLKFSLERKNNNAAQIIISAYKKFIDDQTAAIQNEISQERKNEFRHRDGHSKQVEIMYGDSIVMYVWDFSELSKKYDSFEDQIESLQIHNIINRLKVKDLSEMKYGDSFVKNGYYYIKKEYDLSLEALRYLTQEKGCKFLPTYIGEESGVTKIRAYREDWNGVKFSELGVMLGQIHSLSQAKLGADRVYMYSRGFMRPIGFGQTLRSDAKVITCWEICDIGTPILDIVMAFLNCKGDHRCFINNDKDKSYQELSQFLISYPDRSIIENFGDKFNEEVDRMLENAKQDGQGNNAENIEKLYMVKSFAEIYRNELNLITRQDCVCKED